jgi:hypothetical protein
VGTTVHVSIVIRWDGVGERCSSRHRGAWLSRRAGARRFASS